jgi:hypothetical protein
MFVLLGDGRDREQEDYLQPHTVRAATAATQQVGLWGWGWSGPHQEGSWKNVRIVSPPRRAAEDAPVTAQHDVPRWARGRWRPAAVRLRGWAMAAAPGRIFTFTG